MDRGLGGRSWAVPGSSGERWGETPGKGSQRPLRTGQPPPLPGNVPGYQPTPVHPFLTAQGTEMPMVLSGQRRSPSLPLIPLCFFLHRSTIFLCLFWIIASRSSPSPGYRIKALLPVSTASNTNLTSLGRSLIVTCSLSHCLVSACLHPPLMSPSLPGSPQNTLWALAGFTLPA